MCLEFSRDIFLHRMTDYVFRVPSPNFLDCQRTSTAGDSSTQVDQWLWPPQALFNTPSRKLGMSWTDEIYLRARAVNWAVRICIALQLPQLIIASASAYIHRFYMRKPLQKYSPKVMSATALFLATKVEEVPRKLEYVVREYFKIDEDGNEQMGLLPEESNEFQVLKQQILYYEDILLCTLCFDLAVDHPYVPLVNNVRVIHEAHSSARSPNSSVSVELADRSKAKSITQAAWGFINDSLMTPLCLFARPELIAAAAFLIAVAHRLSECPPPDDNQPHSKDANDKINLDHYINLPANAQSGGDEPWWKVFRIESEEEIYPVANAMLDQYEYSVSDYIRVKAATIARFPGPSLLFPPVENVKTESSSQMNSEAPSPNLASTTPQDVVNGSHNNGNSDVPTPQMTGGDLLQNVEMAFDRVNTENNIPLPNIPEHEALHPQDAERNSKKSANTVPPVNQHDQGESGSHELENAPKIDCAVQSPIINGEEGKLRSQDLRSHQGNSTPVRHAYMSDNMDLGTSVGSNNSASKSNPASPPDLDRLKQYQSTTLDKTPTVKKRSRSSENSPDELHPPPKTPRLEHTPKASIEALPTHLPATASTELSSLSELTDHNVDQAKQNLSARDSDTSLSDMEDGELD